MNHQPPSGMVNSRPCRGATERFFHGAHELVLRYPKRILTIAVLIMLAGLAMPKVYSRVLSRRWAIPETHARMERTFRVLAYSLNSPDETGEIQWRPERWREHLVTLRESGYTPIGLSDVQDLFLHDRPLPRRAVLITFNLGHARSSWAEYQRAVVTTRSRAVLLVDPERPVPGWRALRRVAATPHWELGIACRMDIGHVEGLDGLPPSQRIRRMEQYVLDKQRRMRVTLRRPFPMPVMAFAYPRRPLDLPGANEHDIWETLLARHAGPTFTLGLTRGQLAMNTSRSDPLRLNRMVVSPSWSGLDLVERLNEQDRMISEIVPPDGAAEPAVWMPALGIATVDTGQVVLQSPPSGVAGLWLAGSRQFSDFVADLLFEIDKGALHLPFLASPSRSFRWELRLSNDGNATLYNLVGANEKRLAQDRWSPPPGISRLHLEVRQQRVRVSLNDRRLFNGWLALSDDSAPGLLGLQTVGSETVGGAVRLHAIRVAEAREKVAVWDGTSAKLPGMLAWLADNVSDLTMFSPPLRLMDAAADDDSALPFYDSLRLSHIASRVHHWQLIPHLDVHIADDLMHWNEDRVLTRIEPLNADGVMIRLSDRGEWSLATVAAWAAPLGRALSRQGQRLLIRFPEAMPDSIYTASVLGGIPGVQRVVAATASDLEKRNAVIEAYVPSAIAHADFQPLFELMAEDRDPESEDRLVRIQRWRDEAEAFYGIGDDERAIASWFEWHEVEPNHPTPLRRIGDALNRLGFADESADFYRQSLDRDPGNIPLALYLADWFENHGRRDESRNLIQTYAVLFPSNIELMIAQAEQLMRDGRLSEARSMVLRVLDKAPDHLKAALLIAQLAQSPDEQRAAAHRIAGLGSSAEHRYPVLRAIRDDDLMSLPFSDVLLPLLRQPIRADDDTRLQALVDELVPREEKATATADKHVELSDAWRLVGARTIPDPGRFHFRAAPDRDHLTIRLAGSERWHDVFVEADLVDFSEEFWLVARRSRNFMVRFGFEADSERLHMQIWNLHHGGFRLAHHQNREWTKDALDAGVRLRLEVRGNAALGFVNGEPWGLHPLPLPVPLDPGWVAVKARSILAEDASVVLRQLSAGPLFPALATPFEASDAAALRIQAERLRSIAPTLTGISPAGITIQSDGAWSSRSWPNDEFLRLFARYYGLRFMPRVAVADNAPVRASDILQAGRIHDVDGFLLEMRSAPSAAWIDQLNQDLRESKLMVILSHPDGDHTLLTGCGRAQLLFPGESAQRRARLLSGAEVEAWRKPHQDHPLLIQP